MIFSYRGVYLLLFLLKNILDVPFTSAFASLGKRPPIDAIFWSSQDSNVMEALRRTAHVSSFKSFSCAGRQNKLYPDLSSRCSSYYRCLNGVSYSYRCLKRSLFSQAYQKCRSAGEVECPIAPPTTERCWYQTDGFYPSYQDGCSSYYSCKNGTVEDVEKCESGSIWDSATGSCGFGMQVACNAPSCEGMAEGFYPLQGSACSAYYYCKAGNRTDLLCPPDSIFDYMKKNCIYGSKAVCYEGACDDKINGLHAAAGAPCNTYYRCFNGALLQLEECPPGQIFNGRECVYAPNYTCWSEGGGSCENRSDGLYEAENSDCRGFFFCRNRQVIRSFRCDRGLVFNGKSCVIDTNYICPTKPQIPDCTQKFDGYYTVDKTKCKRFFRCRSGIKVSEHSCPGSYVFNGNQCVDSLLYTCPSRELGHVQNNLSYQAKKG